MPSPTSKPQSGLRHHHHHQQPPQDSPRHGSSHGPDTSAAAHSHVPSSHGALSALPLSFRRLPFQSNHHPPPSTSLVPSVAEGRPIPVDDSTAEHRTEALREFNSHYPSRHRYAKSTGAENTTYSEPVIVRSYYRSPPNRANRLPPRGANSGGSSSQGGIVVVRNGHSTAGSVNGSVASRTRASPLAGKMASASSGMLSIMARARGQNSRPAAHRALPEDAKLPPIEAFSFKSFLENLDEEAEAAAAAANGTSSSDINADLDRIAEICARSRYSLSNQYEVHYGPHGSGTAFVAEGGGSQGPQHNHHHQGGPTLQAVTSDDETNTRTARKRRLGGGARRNSRAMGTLETIMSSSRSSDDDRSKKKSAADIADEVRGRASAKTSHHTSPAGSTASARAQQQQQDQAPLKKQRPGVKRTPSSSLALIDAAGKTTTGPSTGGESTPHSASVVSLVGEPALPQPCTSQLQVHTATARADAAAGPDGVSAVAQHPSTAAAAANPLPRPATHGAVSAVVVDGATATGFLSTLAGWIPWSTGSASTNATLRPQQGRAAGSLRSLLRIADDNNNTHCHH